MKAYKKLVPAIAMLVVSAVAMTTSAYAWFSMNRTVNATGMIVKAKAESSLVINNALAVGTAVTYDFNSDATELEPATHETTDYTTYANGLKKIDATTKASVDAGTGYATSYTYETATANTDYVEYVVYIASAGGALSGQDLTAEFDATTKGLTFTDVTDDTKQAVSIDFYVDTVTDKGVGALTSSATTYKGTLNLKNRATGSVKLVDNGAIPVNKDADNGLRITMRVYFDGALEKTTGHAYVYSDSISTADVEVGVNFTAAAHAAG